MIENACDQYLKKLISNMWDGVVVLLKGNKQNLSAEELETLYAVGYNYFQYGKYQEAVKIFQLLTMVSPTTGYYWRALGAVNQQIKDYRRAITAYNVAAEYDYYDLISRIYVAECHFLSGDKKAGIKALEKVLELGGNMLNPWVKRAQLLLRLNK